MKNIVKTIMVVALVLLTNTSFAMIKERQANIGGLCQGMSIEQVENTLGKNYTRTNQARNRYSLIYPNGPYVEITGNMVTYIEVARNNGVETYDGLHVGSTMGEVEDTLGRADYEDGNFHLYRASGKKDIAFAYTKDNVVATIYSGISYEDEEAVRKEEENNKRERIDVGDEIVIRTRQLREAYWNLRDVFNHGGYRPWGW